MGYEWSNGYEWFGYEWITSSQAGDGAEGVAGVSAYVLLGVEEVGNEGGGIEFLVVGEAEDVGLGLAIDIVVDVDGVGDVVVDEAVALPVDHVRVLVGLLLAQHHVLERGEGLPDFLDVVASLVLPAAVLPLVGEGVVLASLLDLVLRPLLVLLQEDLLDVGQLHLELEGELG